MVNSRLLNSTSESLQCYSPSLRANGTLSSLLSKPSAGRRYGAFADSPAKSRNLFESKFLQSEHRNIMLPAHSDKTQKDTDHFETTDDSVAFIMKKYYPYRNTTPYKGTEESNKYPCLPRSDFSITSNITNNKARGSFELDDLNKNPTLSNEPKLSQSDTVLSDMQSVQPSNDSSLIHCDSLVNIPKFKKQTKPQRKGHKKAVKNYTNNCLCCYRQFREICPVHFPSGEGVTPCPSAKPKPCSVSTVKLRSKERARCGGKSRKKSGVSKKAEAKKIYLENDLLKEEKMELRQSINCLRQKTMMECAEMLQTLLSECEKRDNKRKGIAESNDKPHYVSPCPPSICSSPNAGAGCSKGACGGYTPSGWNKASARQSLAAPECCPPPPFPKSPCAPHGDCEEKPRPVGQNACVSGVVDCNGCLSMKILGEMVFQLERRILEYVFGKESGIKRRFYGYTVSNICYMMAKESMKPCGKVDCIDKSDKAFRFQKLMCQLQKYGYNVKTHPAFSQDIVNRYGVLACPPDQCTVQQYRLQEPCYMTGLVSKLCGSPSEVACLNVILRCLCYMSRCDGRPLFVW